MVTQDIMTQRHFVHNEFNPGNVMGIGFTHRRELAKEPLA